MKPQKISGRTEAKHTEARHKELLDAMASMTLEDEGFDGEMAEISMVDPSEPSTTRDGNVNAHATSLRSLPSSITLPSESLPLQRANKRGRES